MREREKERERNIKVNNFTVKFQSTIRRKYIIKFIHK